MNLKKFSINFLEKKEIEIQKFYTILQNNKVKIKPFVRSNE